MQKINMYDIDYVKKRRKKIIAAICAFVGGVVTITLSIIAFTGRNLGDFTMSIKNNKTSLSMDTDKLFPNPRTFIAIDELPNFDTYSVYYMPSDSTMDSLDSNDTIGYKKDSEGNNTGLYFYKITYLVQNSGETPASFSLSLNLVDNIKGTNSTYGLDEILRIRCYENTGDDDHSFVTYAKKRYDCDTESDTCYECIGDKDGEGCKVSDSEIALDENGYCTNFVDDSTIFSREYLNLGVGETVRYTLVIWLEGFDPECVGEKPKDAKLKLALEYNAYLGENTETEE